MGADFCVATIPFFVPSEERRRQLLDCGCVLLRSAEGDELLNWLDDEMEPGAASDAALNAALSAAFLDIRVGREITILQFKELPYVVLATGGMTWGDMPTNAYSSFVLLALLGDEAWEMMTKWASDDKSNGHHSDYL